MLILHFVLGTTNQLHVMQLMQRESPRDDLIDWSIAQYPRLLDILLLLVFRRHGLSHDNDIVEFQIHFFSTLISQLLNLGGQVWLSDTCLKCTCKEQEAVLTALKFELDMEGWKVHGMTVHIFGNCKRRPHPLQQTDDNIRNSVLRSQSRSSIMEIYTANYMRNVLIKSLNS